MNERYIYALGVFDGVHRGHQVLLEKCVELAKLHDCIPAVVTFDVHPESIVNGQSPVMLLSAQDRCAQLEKHGIKKVYTLCFDQKLRSMPWTDFFQMLRDDLAAAGIVCGDDFRFGYKGQGNAALLRQACREESIPCVVVPEQTVDGVRVSSTLIRRLIEDGEMEKALRFLGHPHSITGTVVEGRHLGRTIGIPTANLLIPEGVVTPKFGVYACQTVIDGKTYMAVTNVGNRPTVGGHRVTVEPWILDFDGDLYGKKLQLSFRKFLRPEEKFDSLETLRQEILKNAEETRKIFENT